MSKRQNLLAVWQQIPVANRTVEVNTKTGFSLTAASYVVRASSTQALIVLVDSATSNTGAISSVTVTRASLYHAGQVVNTGSLTDPAMYLVRSAITSATVVTTSKITSTNAATQAVSIAEFF